MRVIAFAVITILFVWISRRTLLAPGSHGFYRFFAWEAILALTLVNLPIWYRDPFSWYQILSWTLLTISFIPLIMGIHHLRTFGKPDKKARSDAGLLGFEKTTQLVTGGIYHLIRHPLYSSLFLLDWGVFLKLPNTVGLILAGSAALFLFATAKADEQECILVFGQDYKDYMKRTKMFLPYVL